MKMKQPSQRLIISIKQQRAVYGLPLSYVKYIGGKEKVTK